MQTTHAPAIITPNTRSLVKGKVLRACIDACVALGGDASLGRAQIELCADACAACELECRKHADMEDCRGCADACKRCEAACRAFLSGQTAVV